MTETGPIVPGEFAGYVQEHVALSAQYDQAQRDAGRVVELGRTIPEGISATEVAALTGEADPSSEIHAAVQRLDWEVQEAGRLQKAIESGNQEIAQIEQRYRIIMIGGALMIFLLLLIAIGAMM